MKKGVVSAVLAVCLTAAVLILPIVNARSLRKEEEKPDKLNKASSVIVDNDRDEKTETEISPVTADRTVTFVISVSGESLLDRFISLNGKYQNVAELLMSGEGKQYSDNMKKSQAVVKASIQKMLPESDFTDSFTYTAVFSGFSVKAPLSSYEKLQKIKDIQSVIICNDTQYTNEDDKDSEDNSNETESSTESVESEESETVETGLDQSDENDEILENNEESEEDDDSEKQATVQTMSASFKSMMNTDYAYQNGCTGSGGLIAVIDDEFDCSHSAFSALPDQSKYSESDLNLIFASTKFNINTSYSFKDVYKSGKIIFAYDYADKDNETYSGGDSHGTCVAGVAAGNNGKDGSNSFKGVAYDAQLALMKVSTNEESQNGIISNTDAVFAALDDSVKLGADVINCSFGSARNIYGTALYKNTIEKLNAAGIAFVTSAGNDSYNGSDVSEISQFDTAYIDYSTISDLGMLDGSFTAASAENRFYPIYRMKIEEKEIIYTEPENTESVFNENITSETEYCYLGAQGDTDDYDEKDVFGKIVILDSGELTPEQQIENAYANGAVGVMILTDEKTIKLSSAVLPAALVSKDYTEFFSENEQGSLLTEENSYLYTESNNAEIAAGSSYGVTPDLKLKPDITAPGGHLLSSADNDEYQIVSGTSMAAPCTAGALLLLKQYTENSSALSGLAPSERNDRIKALIMSNADVLPYDSLDDSDSYNAENDSDSAEEAEETTEISDDMNTVGESDESGEAAIDDRSYTTPRLSGAGLVNLERAISSNAYLTAESTGLAKMDIGDSVSGEYTFNAIVHNLSDNPKQYSVAASIQTDSFDIENGHFVNTLVPYSLADGLTVTVSVNDKNADTITVAAHSEQTFTVSIALDPTTVLAYRNFFENGFYVDGYLFLKESDGTKINIPVLGFCGDWSEPDIFDSTVYDSRQSVTGLDNFLCAVSDSDFESKPYSLGVNQFIGKAYTENISIGKDTIRNVKDNAYLGNAYILPCFYMLRDAYDFTVTISAKDGKILFTHNYGAVGSFRSDGHRPYEQLVRDSSDLKEFFSTLSEGQYIYIIGAKTMDFNGNLSEEKFQSFSFVIDNTRPVDVSHKTYEKDGKIYLELTAEDETALQGFQLYTAVYNSQTEKYDYADNLDSLIEAGYLSENSYHIDDIKQNTDGSVTFLYDITELRSSLGRLSLYTSSDAGKLSPLKIAYKTVDYAFNTSYARTVDTVVYGSAEFKLTDQNKKPVSGVKISLEGNEKISDENGIVTFDELLTNMYEADIIELPENYTTDRTMYLISILPGKADLRTEIKVHFDGEYEESSEDSSSAEESEESVETSAEESQEDVSDDDLIFDTSDSENTETGDDSYYALAFVGTILIISVGALLLSKYQKREIDVYE